MDQDMSQIVPSYESTDDSIVVNDEPLPAKRQRCTVEYSSSLQFASLEDAKGFIKKQKLWQFKSTSPSSSGTKMIYLCKFDNKCTCPVFAKDYICKHILAIAITNRHFRVMPEAKWSQGDLSKKRQRGRPRKATKALVVD